MDHTTFRSIWSDLQGLAYEQAHVEAGGIRTRYLHAGTRGKPDYDYEVPRYVAHVAALAGRGDRPCQARAGAEP